MSTTSHKNENDGLTVSQGANSPEVTKFSFTALDLSNFEPQEGTFDFDVASTDEMNELAVEAETIIAAEIFKKTGVHTTVECFKSNGHAITNDFPSYGNFLVTKI